MSELTGAAQNFYEKLCGFEGSKEEVRPLVLDASKQALAEWKLALQTQFEDGKLTGIEAATKMAALHDDLLRALFVYADTQMFPTSAPEPVSLCAVGGYGRGEMAPFSDIDLLILNTDKQPSERCQNLSEYLLYMLWDLGLKVGHAVRTPEQSIALAREDHTVLSALLDLRLLAGTPEPAVELVDLLRKERTRAKTRAYITAKLAAREGRHNLAGNSRYVIEPNIKEGKGGLRDLHELYWISRFVYGKKSNTTADAPLKPHGVSAYVRHGLLNALDADRFTEAAEFLWQVRHHLHYLAGRATESLSFDRQDALAVRMGYTEKTPEARVEAFMHTYFMTAREVGALTRIACAKLESQSEILLPQGLDRFLPTSRRGLKAPGFVLDHGRLNFSNPKALKKNPVLILRLFHIAGARNLDIHPDAFATLAQNMSLIDDEFRASKEACEIFLEILLKSAPPGAVLQTMNEASVLGAYLPEFGAIVASTQFNMHHAYTVDDHTISLIKFLHDLETDELAREHPHTTKFLKGFTERQRKCLYLACLFHDVGKSEGDQCLDGARMARQATSRMGLPDADSDTIAWLVRNHLEMSETAQRRDTSDPATIENFARTVGSVARLQMLTALTVVDIRAVGPGIWNDWKGELMRQVYDGALQYLLDGSYDPAQESVNSAFDDLQGKLEDTTAKASAPMFKSLGESYWKNTPQDVQIAHATFFENAATAHTDVKVDAKAKNTKASHFVRANLNRPKDVTELWILSRDRTHLFADIAGAIAINGASVTGAQLYTGEDGFVFNIFYLQNPEGLAFGRQTPARLAKLEATTLQALKGKLGNLALPPTQPSRRADAIPIHPRAAFVSSDKNSAIIEVSGRDRPGLLYDLGRTFDAHGLSIHSAHMEVLGPKAIDVFYVSYAQDISLNEERLRADLIGVLSDMFSTQPDVKSADNVPG
ncbi:MAG: [protein-PII] uridylyltransferase [Robiginitomaculum sp.]|nr:MAG: [protein-PII] uridylyltransferase [Robiginitomaculum sp.]